MASYRGRSTRRRVGRLAEAGVDPLPDWSPRIAPPKRQAPAVRVLGQAGGEVHQILNHASQPTPKHRLGKRHLGLRRERLVLGQRRLAAHAHREEARAVALAADVATLLKWLREDVLSLAGPDHATRRELFDFIVAELRLREPLCSHRIGPVVRALTNQRDDQLAFPPSLRTAGKKR